MNLSHFAEIFSPFVPAAVSISRSVAGYNVVFVGPPETSVGQPLLQQSRASVVLLSVVHLVRRVRLDYRVKIDAQFTTVNAGRGTDVQLLLPVGTLQRRRDTPLLQHARGRRRTGPNRPVPVFVIHN